MTSPRLVARLAVRWLLVLLVALSSAACQKTKPADQGAAGKKVYYTCSMHPQIHEDAPGKCPICSMDLILVKTAPATPKPGADAAVYTCPMHPQVHQAKPGLCPICGMDLVKQAVRSTAAGKASGGSADLTLTAQQVTLGNIRAQVIGPDTGRAKVLAPTVLTGTITADALQTEGVSSRVAGRIEQLYVRQTGQILQRGAPLFSVYSEQLQALQQEYLLALAQSREQGGPYRQFAEATAQKLRLLGLSATQLRQLAARGRPNPVVTYYSPTTGTVQTLDVVQGQYVSEGTPLVTLTNLATVWVEAQLNPQDVAKLPLGKTVTMQVAGESGSLRGKVVFLSPELSGSSQVALARIQLANPGGRLLPGAQANVLLDAPATAATAQTALRVPTEALIREGDASYLWTQTGERQYRRVRVSTGEGSASSVPVTSGLPPGTRVVVSGAYLLQSEYALRQGATDSMNGMSM
ncbi:efflux RND transporter periplasmic adaptor subunit [Hymenobacter sp. BT186]|uniref:Efflux RND transporter periplasmic adaptor subunit n=1 Tax=Hymenobacter telluris TaxID=2816474 RepID=A0A939JB29_9BACT|nr:efflux RND transporter periplasmic adaptor subunit [Hymenobacter telluris]MBO0360489.1 efflux RND transporter periplasmic adaptor subunit [Hymenobacter telluris]MBW3376516.1 efflux RND transporter periplasmic adaptor subunit [Hymenobacter norwichensis]